MLQKGTRVWFVDSDVELNGGVMYELGQGEILDMDTLHFHQTGETHWVVRWDCPAKNSSHVESHSPQQLTEVAYDL